MTKGEIAKNNFMQGYNCAQAVLLAFCDDLGFDEQTALMLASPFGGGIGRMREVCGTVTGMYMALGLARGYSDSKDNADKKRVYTEVQQLAERFKEDNGSIICRDLLGMRAKARITRLRLSEQRNIMPPVRVLNCADMQRICLMNT